MDERELTELFRAVPGEPPPAAFDVRDVRDASARATARRRMTLAAASLCVVFALLGAGIMGFVQSRTTPSNQVLGQEQPVGGPVRLPTASGLPGPSAMQGGVGTGENGPRADGTPGCDKVDRELAAALAGELPSTGVTGPRAGDVCTPGSRSASYGVAENGRSGTVSATVLPPGASVQLAKLVEGAVADQQRAAGGGTVIVLSVPAPGSAAPLADDVTRIARSLAGKF
ncbi:hypothetical protein GCM10027445_44420 [Amycolatopsis endophytica]|uniref:Uncharacterized protein n=1 Tax=Amycolatopsis endophytica TaxID=860233 RepID=A0A853B1W8_9PSEU|nr:hypothetical protein [Amycolatopsis endophytica]NYI88666.1 hypothetical protein [Amycolatopsis endophytica]